jgi:hypothetical protein
MFLRTINKKVGELLIERNIITPEQLQDALEQQNLRGGYVSQHLIALKFATEYDIAICLSNQYHLAYLPLKNYFIPREVLKKVPLKWIRIYKLIPVDKVGSSLSIAMADPLNEGAIQMIQQITGLQVCVFISTFSEIEETIERYFKDEFWETKRVSEADMRRFTILDEYIQTKVYNGRERRKFIRIAREVELEYLFHGQTLSAKTINLSFGGICFNSRIFVPIDCDLVCKIDLEEDRKIDCVVKVLRVENKNIRQEPDDLFEIGAVFEFIDGNDRAELAEYLKKYI